MPRVVDMLTANYTFLNVHGSHFRRVTQNDPNRAGLLGHGSVLTVTSYSTRTSPVIRSTPPATAPHPKAATAHAY